MMPFSSPHWIVASLAVACMVSFLSRQMGVMLGATYAGIQLRGEGEGNRNRQARTAPLIQDFDLTPPRSLDDSIPECARDVFLTLHKNEGGEDESACRGMLIRDDIILTSNECSRFSFKFRFPGGISLSAVPHTPLNSKERLLDSRLGFLKANPPYHYHFANKPVRRTRLFLSRQPKHVVMKCAENKPVAHNFPVDGELVPLGHLFQVLPDDVLWEDLDINTAYMLERISQRWWTRSITREAEEKTVWSIFKQYEGPSGSLSLLNSAKGGIISEMAAICEVIDPLHRRKECFKNYYYRWSEAKHFSGMHFFDWLDFGPGKLLLEKNETDAMLIHSEGDIKCVKAVFNAKRVHYFTEEERLAHEVYLEQSKGGKEVIARYKINDEPVRPSHRGDPHLYMWDMDKKLYVVDDTWDEKKYGSLKHTGLLAGKAALGAGKADFGENGAIIGINYSSGHYQPNIQSLSMMYQWMKDQRLNVTAFHWVGRTEGTGRTAWSTKSCTDYDWNSVEVPGYSPIALNRSCHEVTTSPTWVLQEDIARR